MAGKNRMIKGNVRSIGWMSNSSSSIFQSIKKRTFLRYEGFMTWSAEDVAEKIKNKYQDLENAADKLKGIRKYGKNSGYKI